MTAAAPKGWANCACGHGPESHDAVVVKPICVERSGRVLFEGVLGGCVDCGCVGHELRSAETSDGTLPETVHTARNEP